MNKMLDHYIEMMNLHLRPGTWHGQQVIMCNRIGDNPTVVDTWRSLERYILKMAAQYTASIEAAEASANALEIDRNNQLRRADLAEADAEKWLAQSQHLGTQCDEWRARASAIAEDNRDLRRLCAQAAELIDRAERRGILEESTLCAAWLDMWAFYGPSTISNS